MSFSIGFVAEESVQLLLENEHEKVRVQRLREAEGGPDSESS